MATKPKPDLAATAEAAVSQARLLTEAAEKDAQAARPQPPAKKRKSGSKTKEALNVPKHHIITWVPADFTPEDHTRLVKVAKQHNTNLDKLLYGLISEQLSAKAAEFDQDVLTWDQRTVPMTVEQLEAQLLKGQAKLQAIEAQLAAVHNARK